MDKIKVSNRLNTPVQLIESLTCILMEKFIVSARKYRPQTFNTVVGQSHITTTLKNAIKHNQLAHAFLFCGPRGVGKTTCARILAKTINCENIQSNGEACNECKSCKSFNSGISLNIHELDAASNNSVDDIRNLVEQVRFAPQAGKYKVYIVDEVHMLSSSAFNAFLKTLEEPPSYAIFILATTEKHKILPTILSRCQIFDFKRITGKDTVEHLQEIAEKESVKAEKAALQLIAQKSEGCMRDSLSILDKIVSFTGGDVSYKNTIEHLNILDEDSFFQLLEFLKNEDLASTMLLYDAINQKGFEGDIFLSGFQEFLRNLLVAKDPKAAVLLDVLEGMQDRYLEVAKSTDMSFLVTALNILNETEVNYRMARNKRLHIEMALIKLNFLQQAIAFSAEKDGPAKKKRLDQPVAFKTTKIEPFQVKVPKLREEKPSKLYIQAEPETAKAEESPAPKNEERQKQPTSKLNQNQANLAAEKEGSKRNRNSLLDGLRKKYGEEYLIEEIQEAEDISAEKLKPIFENFAAKLEAQFKHTSAQALRGAKINIESANFFTLTVNNNLQLRFIENEKTVLNYEIQDEFKNRSISFKVLVSETEKDKSSDPVSLNSRQRYELMAAKNPFIKELKERLRLEIDY